jgi:hypothetical protein
MPCDNSDLDMEADAVALIRASREGDSDAAEAIVSCSDGAELARVLARIAARLLYLNCRHCDDCADQLLRKWQAGIRRDMSRG